MNTTKFVSFVMMLTMVASLSFAQGQPMKKKMMGDSTKTKMMMNKGKMMKSDKMMDHDMMFVQNDKGIAIMGYDPVAYFEDSEAEMGTMQHSYNWGGATWYFTNKDHMMMFQQNPEKYAPQYGGNCAFGASEGHLGAADPTAWVIKDGKLYLNSNSDVCKSFEMEYESRVMKANKKWKEENSNHGM